ncbi:precorrin-8X methylmutase [Zongyangia sp. HA2173]|uniref:precorrin-8X methylmutase n=1 Tax=Zongyangia sp. HA2173 TaxID=3133035 RepID=UPI0031680AC1
MNLEMEHVLPQDIERRSMEIIAQELGDRWLDDANADVIKRVIHTTADFDYADTLCFSPSAVEKARAALQRGADIVTDTQMAKAGINKQRLGDLGGQVHCFMSDEDVAKAAKEQGTTRAVASMDKALSLQKPLIFAIGNAPTALIRLYEHIQEERIRPELVIGVPVGFVNVVYAKELIMQADVPFIVARGRKGGSNVAAAIVNALLYGMGKR